MRTSLLAGAAVLSVAGAYLAGQSGAAESALKAQPALKDVFKGSFLIGAAVNQAQFTEQNVLESQLVKKQFNSITPENVVKWEAIHPEPERYNFGPADRYVDFGEKNGMFVVGHTLVWHQQTPLWVFESAPGKPASREELLKRMSDHIHTVVGRYKGRVRGWDVVNEALAEDGTLRQTPWLKMIGEDYLVKAFQFAHEADPAAELYYNDYSLENPAKRMGAVALFRKLREAGAAITGVGSQTHIHLRSPAINQVDDAIADLGKAGAKVMVTELDVNLLPSLSPNEGADLNVKGKLSAALNPYPNGLPDEMQQELAQRYADLFTIFMKHRDVLQRVTFWGVTDRGSWLNDWPVRGRTNYPLLFDRAGNPKLAFGKVLETAGTGK